MKIGFIDLNQPSTWRGIVGLAGLFGIAVSPELTDQIAIAMGAIFAGIEIYRDERKAAALPKIELQGRPDPVGLPVEQLRNDPLQAQPDAEFGGNDRGWNG